MLGHDTTDCIVTQQGWEAARRGAPRHGATGHDTATTQPRYGQAACDATGQACDTARSALVWELGHSIKIISWLRGGDVGVTIRRNRVRHDRRHDSVCSAIRRWVHARQGPGFDMADQACYIAGQACDTAEEGATTRPSARHDTALCARPVRAGWVRCVHCTPNLVLTQCTVFSHCLGHCS